MPQYHVAIAYGVLLIMEVLFLPETLYPRRVIQQMIAQGENYAAFPRTMLLHVWVSSIPTIPSSRPMNIHFSFWAFSFISR